jgi:hypothetical protein
MLILHRIWVQRATARRICRPWFTALLGVDQTLTWQPSGVCSGQRTIPQWLLSTITIHRFDSAYCKAASTSFKGCRRRIDDYPTKAVDICQQAMYPELTCHDNRRMALEPAAEAVWIAHGLVMNGGVERPSVWRPQPDRFRTPARTLGRRSQDNDVKRRANQRTACYRRRISL